MDTFLVAKSMVAKNCGASWVVAKDRGVLLCHAAFEASDPKFSTEVCKRMGKIYYAEIIISALLTTL